MKTKLIVVVLVLLISTLLIGCVVAIVKSKNTVYLCEKTIKSGSMSRTRQVEVILKDSVLTKYKVKVLFKFDNKKEFDEMCSSMNSKFKNSYTKIECNEQNYTVTKKNIYDIKKLNYIDETPEHWIDKYLSKKFNFNANKFLTDMKKEGHICK